MEIFRGIQVKSGISSDGNIKTINVPVAYGSMDKVTAAISTQNTTNLPLRVPMMTCYLNNISMAQELYVGVDTTKEDAYTPRGGMFPEDVKTLKQLRPTPYKLSLDTHIIASNSEQLFQILEQLLVLFNPSIQFQISDRLYDGSKITSATLMGITNNENFPMGADKRTISYSLNFDVICYLAIPAKLKNDRIQTIQLRINNLTDDLAEFDEEIIISVKDTL
jgi:hypothetical protein